MNRNLYSKELKRNTKNLIIWTSIVIGFTILVMSIFPYMKNMGNEMSAMLDQLPVGLTKAMGIHKQTFNSIIGLYNTYYGLYIIILLSIYASSTATVIITKEQKDKTADFLLTKPISRKSIFLTKTLSLFTLTLIAFLVQTLTALFFVSILGEEQIDWSIFWAMHFHGLVLILFFTSVGLFLSMLLKARKSFMGMMVGIVFGSYFINTIAKVADPLTSLGFLSPFHYLDFEIHDPSYSINYLAISSILFLSVLMLFLSYKIYNVKDMTT